MCGKGRLFTSIILKHNALMLRKTPKIAAVVGLILVGLSAGCHRSSNPLLVRMLAPPDARHAMQSEVLSFGREPRSTASGRNVWLLTMEASDEAHYQEYLRRYSSSLQIIVVADANDVPPSAVASIPVCRQCQRTWFAYIPKSAEGQEREGAQLVLQFFRAHDPTS